MWLHELIRTKSCYPKGKINLNQNKDYGPVLASTYITLPWIKAGVILASQSLMRSGISPYMTRIKILLEN